MCPFPPEFDPRGSDRPPALPRFAAVCVQPRLRLLPLPDSSLYPGLLLAPCQSLTALLGLGTSHLLHGHQQVRALCPLFHSDPHSPLLPYLCLLSRPFTSLSPHLSILPSTRPLRLFMTSRCFIHVFFLLLSWCLSPKQFCFNL